MKYIKFGIGVSLLFALFHFGILDLKLATKAASQPFLMALAVLVMMGPILVHSLRWNILLSASGQPISWVKTLQIVWSTNFFNAFLPGAFGGDLVRAAYVVQATESKRTNAIFSLLMDRLTGMGGALTLGVLVSLFYPIQDARASGYAIYVFFLGFLAANAVLLLYGHRVSQFIGARFPKKLGKLAEIVEEISQALKSYLHHWRRVAACWILSVLLYAFAISGLLITTMIMDIGNLDLPQYAVSGIWALLANNIPITPGGLGVGESAFAKVCMMLEVVPSGAAYATIFLVYRAIAIMASLPGVITYLTYRHGKVKGGVNNAGKESSPAAAVTLPIGRE